MVSRVGIVRCLSTLILVFPESFQQVLERFGRLDRSYHHPQRRIRGLRPFV